MIKRFSRSDSASSHILFGCDNEAECKCCDATRRARERTLFDPLPAWNSPLTPGVQLSNISYSDDGANLRVDLAENWARMFEQLPAIGSVLVMTRNSGAILGRRMTYPEFAITSGGDKAASGEGGLLLEFRNIGRARAIHLRRETGHVFGVEFSDPAGTLIHRFTLTPDSNMDEFFGWVRLHQACSAHQAPPFMEEVDRGPVRERLLLWRRCDEGVLTSVAAAAVDRAVPLRVTVRSPAVTQRSDLNPISLQPSDDWWFLSDDESGLHFHPDHFTDITLEQHAGEPWGTRLVLRAVTKDGTSALLLEAACPAAEDAWRKLLEAVA